MELTKLSLEIRNLGRSVWYNPSLYTAIVGALGILIAVFYGIKTDYIENLKFGITSLEKKEEELKSITTQLTKDTLRLANTLKSQSALRDSLSSENDGLKNSISSISTDRSLLELLNQDLQYNLNATNDDLLELEKKKKSLESNVHSLYGKIMNLEMRKEYLEKLDAMSEKFIVKLQTKQLEITNLSNLLYKAQEFKNRSPSEEEWQELLKAVRQNKLMSRAINFSELNTIEDINALIAKIEEGRRQSMSEYQTMNRNFDYQLKDLNQGYHGP